VLSRKKKERKTEKKKEGKKERRRKRKKERKKKERKTEKKKERKKDGEKEGKKERRRKERKKKKERKKERFQLSTSSKLHIQQTATIQSRQIIALEFVYETFTLLTHILVYKKSACSSCSTYSFKHFICCAAPPNTVKVRFVSGINLLQKKYTEYGYHIT
jgi:hypothetical protein